MTKMKRFNNVLPAVFLFFISAVLFAATPEFQWGGPGYDPILRESKDYTSSRYTVRLHPSDKEAIDILVDAKETVREVGRMNLIAADKTTVSSLALHLKNLWKRAGVPRPSECLSEIGDIERQDPR